MVAGDRRQMVVDELVDVFAYAFMLADALGILDDLPALILKKLFEVEQRPAWLLRK